MKRRNYINICILILLVLTSIISYASNTGLNKNLSPVLLLQKKKDSSSYKLFKIADSLYKAKNYSVALNIAFKALDQAKEIQDVSLVSDANYLIGRIWYSSRSYKKAIPYFKKSLEGYAKIINKNDSLRDSSNPDLENAYKILNSNYQVGVSYHRLLDVLYSKNNTDTINKKVYRDSTLFYYNKILTSDIFDTKTSDLKSKTYRHLSGLYLRDSLFDLAEENVKKALSVKKTTGDQYSIAIGYNALSNIHFYKNEYEKSKVALFKGLDALKKIKGERADEIRAGLYLNIAYSMYMLKDYHAYEYQEKSWDLYNEINEKNNEQKLADIYAERNFEKGMQEGILKEEIKRQKAERNTWVLGISSFFVIVLLVFLLQQYKLRQKNLSLELSQKELVQQQKIEKVRAESQIRILNATIDGKESERKEIAETLHDSVSALLSSANLHLQACKKHFNGHTPVEVEKSQSIINEASQKIRDLSHTLVSSILLKFGLSYAIKDISEKFSNSELQIDFETKYIKRYDQGFEIKLYNIIQEFVNNILKHSEASYAKITLIEKNKKIHLTIEDDGKGFDKTTIPEKDGLGINQIDARVQMMQGKFHIESAHGKGTVITIELPVFEKEELAAIS